MIERMYKKGLVVGIIVLFVGVGVQSAFAVDIPEKEEIEPKDYLFETIIAIANNPDVQDLLEEYEHNFFNFDFNNKYVFRTLLFKNPELLCSMIFTKPVITMKYLDNTYNQGIELVDIFGWEKSLEMLDSVEFTNPELLDDLNNIILNNEEIFNRVSTLAELNEDNSTICDIIFIFGIMGVVKMLIFGWGVYWLEDFPSLHDYFLTRLNLLEVRFAITAILLFHFNCIEPW
jgi:hypothetical protein